MMKGTHDNLHYAIVISSLQRYIDGVTANT